MTTHHTSVENATEFRFVGVCSCGHRTVASKNTTHLQALLREHLESVIAGLLADAADAAAHADEGCESP